MYSALRSWLFAPSDSKTQWTLWENKPVSSENKSPNNNRFCISIHILNSLPLFISCMYQHFFELKNGRNYFWFKWVIFYLNNWVGLFQNFAGCDKAVWWNWVWELWCNGYRWGRVAETSTTRETLQVHSQWKGTDLFLFLFFWNWIWAWNCVFLITGYYWVLMFELCIIFFFCWFYSIMKDIVLVGCFYIRVL